jgi:hypothetical protein
VKRGGISETRLAISRVPLDRSKCYAVGNLIVSVNGFGIGGK